MLPGAIGVALILVDISLMYSGRDGSFTPIGWVGIVLIALAAVHAFRRSRREDRAQMAAGREADHR